MISTGGYSFEKVKHGLTHLGHVTGVTGAAEHLVHLRQLDALVVLRKENMAKGKIRPRLGGLERANTST